MIREQGYQGICAYGENRHTKPWWLILLASSLLPRLSVLAEKRREKPWSSLGDKAMIRGSLACFLCCFWSMHAHSCCAHVFVHGYAVASSGYICGDL